eukprot:scaffold37549_cov39-Phaeocystis_antarctica.AAC.1
MTSPSKATKASVTSYTARGPPGRARDRYIGGSVCRRVCRAGGCGARDGYIGGSAGRRVLGSSGGRSQMSAARLARPSTSSREELGLG